LRAAEAGHTRKRPWRPCGIVGIRRCHVSELGASARVPPGTRLCRLHWPRIQRGQNTEVSIQERFQYAKAYPDAYKAMLALTQAVERTGLAPQLIDLVNYRVSQLNGCAFCLDMHAKDLRARGETEQRL
jgi:AhpD family alkylhydroperoxidase